jgi:hypothetical protein
VNDDPTAACLLEMCHRVQREFTLREIVARVMDERPEMIMEFAEAWGRLVREKLIRVSRPGLPNTYELVPRDSA